MATNTIRIVVEGGASGGGTQKGTTQQKSNVFSLLEEAKATESLTEKKKLLRQAITLLSKEGSKFEGTIKTLKGAIGQLDKEIAKSKNTWSNAIGSYQFKFNALGNIISNVVSSSVNMLKELGASVINISKDFEFAMSGVRAITMATDDEFKQLTNDAIRLGGATLYTAQDISKLQEELAKLGFTVPEIRAATDGVVALAAATGEDLGQSALVAGTVIRGFGLNAGDLTRVVDVMAQSFNNSALDLYKFSETMKYVAPIASKVGFSVEETTTLMSKLADQGVVASQAGTGLRNIMLRLSDANSNLSKAMGGPISSLPELIAGLKKLKESGIDATGALKLVDRYSVTAFLGLVGASDKLWESYEKLNESFGIAQKMSEIRMDNFAGSVEKLSGAWDSLVLTINKGNGILRIAVDVIRKMIEGVTKLIQSYDQAATISANERLIEYRKTIDKTIEENNRAYTDYIKLLNAQYDQGIISQKEYGEQIKYLKKEQQKDINDITSRMLREQLVNEEKALPELEEISNEKTKLYEAPYKYWNIASKEAARKEMASAQANYSASKKHIEDIKSLISQNELEKVAILNDYADVESLMTEESEKKWKELELVKIEAMQDGMMKEIALVQYGYKKQLEEAEHYGTSTVYIYENMYNDIREVIQKFQKDNAAIAASLAGYSLQMEEGIFRSQMKGQTWSEKQKAAREKSYSEWRNLLNKITEDEEEEIIKKGFWENIYSLTDDQRESLKKGFNFIADQIQTIYDREMELADQRVRNSERVVEQLQQDLNNEIALKEAGFANNVSLKEKELSAAKALQQKALAEQGVIAKRQRDIEAIIQAANLFTTGTEIVKAWTKKEPTTGWLIGLAAAATMFGAYTIWKNNTKSELDKYGEGGEIGGNKHSQGGTIIEAEKGEFVVKASAYSKHADLVQAINNDNLNQIYGELNKDLSVSLDDTGTARMLNKHFGRPRVTYHNGYRIEESANRKRIIRYAKL